MQPPDLSHTWSVRRSFITATTVHVLLFLFAVTFSFLGTRTKINITPAIRVDLVGLPDYTKKELNKIATDPAISELDKKLSQTKKQPIPEPVPIKKPTEEDSVSLKKEKHRMKSSLQNALDRIRALEEIENSVPKPKGNVVSKGNQITGETSQLNATEYATQMQNRLRTHWNLPVWLAKQKLSAKAEVFLDRYGRVEKSLLTKTSGNKQFDDYVLRTIESAQPFGAPPKEWIKVGIELGFPL